MFISLYTPLNTYLSIETYVSTFMQLSLNTYVCILIYIHIQAPISDHINIHITVASLVLKHLRLIRKHNILAHATCLSFRKLHFLERVDNVNLANVSATRCHTGKACTINHLML